MNNKLKPFLAAKIQDFAVCCCAYHSNNKSIFHAHFYIPLQNENLHFPFLLAIHKFSLNFDTFLVSLLLKILKFFVLNYLFNFSTILFPIS